MGTRSRRVRPVEQTDAQDEDYVSQQGARVSSDEEDYSDSGSSKSTVESGGSFLTADKSSRAGSLHSVTDSVQAARRLPTVPSTAVKARQRVLAHPISSGSAPTTPTTKQRLEARLAALLGRHEQLCLELLDVQGELDEYQVSADASDPQDLAELGAIALKLQNELSSVVQQINLARSSLTIIEQPVAISPSVPTLPQARTTHAASTTVAYRPAARSEFPFFRRSTTKSSSNAKQDNIQDEEQFMDLLEIALKYHNVPASEWTRMLCINTEKDTVAKWVEREIVKPDLTWKRARKKFIRHFQDPQHRLRLKEEFYNIAPAKNESMSDYCDRYIAAMEKISLDPAKAHYVPHFAKTLPIWLRKQLRQVSVTLMGPRAYEDDSGSDASRSDERQQFAGFASINHIRKVIRTLAADADFGQSVERSTTSTAGANVNNASRNNNNNNHGRSTTSQSNNSNNNNRSNFTNNNNINKSYGSASSVTAGGHGKPSVPAGGSLSNTGQAGSSGSRDGNAIGKCMWGKGAHLGQPHSWNTCEKNYRNRPTSKEGSSGPPRGPNDNKGANANVKFSVMDVVDESDLTYQRDAALLTDMLEREAAGLDFGTAIHFNFMSADDVRVRTSTSATDQAPRYLATSEIVDQWVVRTPQAGHGASTTSPSN